jgi:hypothetical protein
MGMPQPQVIELKTPPGMLANGTVYDQQNRWIRGSLVRWTRGALRPVGGWSQLQSFVGTTQEQTGVSLTGRPCGALSWRADNNQAWLAMGTHSKAYSYRAGNLYDITPVGFITGNEDGIPLSGYGDGGYGVGPYGYGLSAFAEIEDASSWSFDTFGELLIGLSGPVDGNLYQYDPMTPSTVFSAVTSAPTGQAVVVTPEFFIMVLGANGNAREVAWADQGTLNTWTPEVDVNQAGAQELSTNGRLIAGRRLRNETLLFTDVDVHAASYRGGEFVYEFRLVGEACGLAAQRAVVTIDTRAFWMGRDNFYVYDGFVRPIPCEVWDYIFRDINGEQLSKAWATSNVEFNEVIWFYPSGESDECDRYVLYNYVDGTWSFGEMDRTAGVDRGALQLPVWLSSNGKPWQHETGSTRVATDGTTPLTAYAESGPFQIGPGDIVGRVHTFIPDERPYEFNPDSALERELLEYTLFTSFYPGEQERERGPYNSSDPISVRATGRWVRLRIEERTPMSDWVVGTPRIGYSPMGRR